tara:strand:+ start:682 stop:957 length:276 start_codon:yes stop_codon:yes gene_type:complete
MIDPIKDVVKEVLNERAKTHGSFADVARVAQSIKGAMYCVERRGTVSYETRESLDMIASKIARIICGDESETDHWLDIEGYARLARENMDG